MANIKPLGTTAEKWTRRAGSAAQEYSEGVSAPRRPWAAATLAAAAAYASGVSEAVSRGAFGKGVQAAGDGKWQTKAQTLGAARFASGVQAAEGDYSQGFAKYHQVLSSLTLPPRGSKGSPQNLNRVAAVANALRKAKTG